MQSEPLPDHLNKDASEVTRTIWNPTFMGQQQRQRQQQLQTHQQLRYSFTNPWASENDVSNAYPLQANLIQTGSMLSTLPETEEQELVFKDYNNSDIYKRRKSSIIIPPVRAPGPNPSQYGSGYMYYPSTSIYEVYQNTSHQPPFNSNIQIKQNPGSQFNQDQFLNRTSALNTHNNQEFSRRQTIGSLQCSMDPIYMLPNSAAASSNAQQLLAYRRLNTYPQVSSQPIHPHALPPLRDDSRHPITVSPQPIIIPQMWKCISDSDLIPTINPSPKYRRASLNSKTLSPLRALTSDLITTYSLCSPYFSYKTSKNPKRVLTKPSEGKQNGGFDNINSDYILFVNDILGTEQNRKFLVLDILGQGTFGQVVKCQNCLTKEIVAVKVIKSRSEYINQSVTEVKNLKIINQNLDPSDKHHFLRLNDTFFHKNHLCLVFELLGKNLYELLKQNRFHGLSISLIRKFTHQLLDSLCVLKVNKLVHCDLKPENILLCSNDKSDIKVVDFGSSCEESQTLYTYIQSRFYRAPEVMLGMPYSASIDVWSLGCIVAELFLGIPIFPGSSEYNQMSRIINCLGYPPTWMLEMGKHSSNFFTVNRDEDTIGERNKYQLKTIEKFNIEFNKNEEESKEYFKWQTLPAIIEHNRYPKHIDNSPELVLQENKDRQCLIHFLRGILNMNPLERWTPQQASMHPFITQQLFTGEWYPPGFIPHSVSSSSAAPELNKILNANLSRTQSLQENSTNNNFNQF